jgi:hypothetical protein
LIEQLGVHIGGLAEVIASARDVAARHRVQAKLVKKLGPEVIVGDVVSRGQRFAVQLRRGDGISTRSGPAIATKSRKY